MTKNRVYLFFLNTVYVYTTCWCGLRSQTDRFVGLPTRRPAVMPPSLMEQPLVTRSTTTLECRTYGQ